MKHYLFAIDCGHAKSTKGKETPEWWNGSFKEWELNNEVAKELEGLFESYKNVSLIRLDDVTGFHDVSLADRVKYADLYEVDCLVSIHHNAGGGSGIEVWVHSHGTNDDYELAMLTSRTLARRTNLRNRGVKKQKWQILTCEATAILCEGGFMDNEHDYALITSEYGQRAYALAIHEALCEFYELKTTHEVVNKTCVVRILCDELNIRESASFTSKVVGTVKKNEAFTIVEQRNGLGRLKSGRGWVSMNSKYVKILN